MDAKLRRLERQVTNDPSLIPELAQVYLRTGQLLIPRECEIPLPGYTRGILQGDIFGCLAALQLFANLLEQTNFDTYYGEDEPGKASQWFQNYSDHLINLNRGRFFGSMDYNIMEERFLSPRFDMYGRIASAGWRGAEAVGAWGRRLHWRVGSIRNSSGRGIQWERDNERDLAGTSFVEIHFDWPRLNVNELPTCRIVYDNPTPEMREALCSLNPRFFQHRALPAKPPLREIVIPDAIPDADLIPLHLRGNLVMPTCEQLKNAYGQRFPIRNVTDLILNPRDWYFSVTDVWPVCIQCPGCNQVYSVFKDGGDDTGAYCDNCQFELIEGYIDDTPQLRVFAQQNATHWMFDGDRLRYSIFIPPDCSLKIQEEILRYLAEQGEDVRVVSRQT